MEAARGPVASPRWHEDPAAAADFALLHRPSFSVRKKIALSFLLCFLVIGGVTLASSLILSRIEERLHFIELADNYTSHIQQARRYEKNFLLYGTDLSNARDNLRAARETLLGAQPEIDRVVGSRTHREMMGHLDRYDQLLSRLASAEDKQGIEPELRKHGGEMVEVALRVAEAERRTVHDLLRICKLMPLVAMALLLALIAYVVHFLARQILTPLGRIVGYARRIAEGDFAPVFPTRRYRDEFTDLVLAMNRMTRELDRRQEMLASAQKLRAIGTLTAGVAHELNNPINNISLTAEALLEDVGTLSVQERTEMCRDLLSQAERAQGVVRNLLDFSRQREPRMVSVDVGPLLTRTCKLLSNQVRLSRARIELGIPDGLPPVLGDEQQLAQVFVNLCLNALEAMDRPGRLGVTAERAAGRPGFLRIGVSDTGRGIAPEVLPFIFDPFFTTKGAGGTGLGLSVSYGIVEKHGGTIEAASRVGEGTRFSVYLPFAAAAAP